jgi:hypothetical protein
MRLLAADQYAALTGRAEDCRPAGAIAHEAGFEPWEARKVVLQGRVPLDAQPGQVFAYELSQRLGEIVTGGDTLYVVVQG